MAFDSKAALHKFKQQKLKAWQPILTPCPVILTFGIVGVVFLGLGALLLASSESVTELTVRYDDECGEANGTVCEVEFEVSDAQAEGFKDETVYAYYKLTNFYQNHRRYVKSRNDDQLRGADDVVYDDTEDCGPRRTIDGEEDGALLNPCGLIAWSQFNDSLALLNPSSELVPWQKSGIAWEEDLTVKFNNPPEDANGVRVVPNYRDEDFIVWMRTSGLPTFRKLYRKIHTPLSAGTYKLQVANNFPVSQFDGTKSLVLSTTTWMGGKNNFLGIAYLVVGGLCVFQAIAFAIKQAVDPRDLGDVKAMTK